MERRRGAGHPPQARRHGLQRRDPARLRRLLESRFRRRERERRQPRLLHRPGHRDEVRDRGDQARRPLPIPGGDADRHRGQAAPARRLGPAGPTGSAGVAGAVGATGPTGPQGPGIVRTGVVNADGSGVVRLTDRAGRNFAPAWRP